MFPCQGLQFRIATQQRFIAGFFEIVVERQRLGYLVALHDYERNAVGKLPILICSAAVGSASSLVQFTARGNHAETRGVPNQSANLLKFLANWGLSQRVAQFNKDEFSRNEQQI